MVLEEGLEISGDELDDDGDGLLITGLGDWTVVDKIGEVVVKEGVFAVSEVCAETSGAVVVRETISIDC